MTRCCVDLEAALRDGFLEMNPLDDEEVVLPRRKLTDIAPEARAGNVLTGETYDPATFEMAMAIGFCPFCGEQLADASIHKSNGGLYRGDTD